MREILNYADKAVKINHIFATEYATFVILYMINQKIKLYRNFNAFLEISLL